MDDYFRKFLRTEVALSKEMSTGMTLLDRATFIPIESCMLIRGPAFSGGTAVLLRMCQILSQTKKVFYFDIAKSLLEHRLVGIDKDNFYIVRPWNLSVSEILQIITDISRVDKESVLVFDSAKILTSSWHNTDMPWLLSQSKLISGKFTILGSQSMKPVYHSWNLILDIAIEDKIYTENPDTGQNELKGHTLKVTGPKGTSIVYVDYRTGTLSELYDKAVLEVEQGKSKSSVFEKDGAKIQGFWKFVTGFDNTVINDYGTNTD